MKPKPKRKLRIILPLQTNKAINKGAACAVPYFLLLLIFLINPDALRLENEYPWRKGLV